MPIEKTFTAYTYDELGEAAKEKARRWVRDNDRDDALSSITEDAENIGLIIVAFDATTRYVDGYPKDRVLYVAEKIVKEHGEWTETRRLADAFLAKRETDKDYQRFLQDILNQYGRMYHDQWMYSMSDEGCEEWILSNEYLFDETGSRTVTL